MKQDLYVDALLRRAERTGTRQQLDATVRGLEDLIEASLRSALISRNEKFNTATGNAYQTVRLRTKEIEGFRSARDHVFAGIELKGKIVHDYGSNLGEVSRAAARRGAHFVRSFEFEPFFVFMAKLINVLHGHDNIRTFLADISDVRAYKEPADVTVALSVFTFIAGQLPALAQATRDVLIFESHAVAQGTLRNSLEALRKHFSQIAVVDALDHGAGSESWRVLCLASNKPLHEVIGRRLTEKATTITADIDLTRTKVVPWNSLSWAGKPWADQVQSAQELIQSISQGEPVTDAKLVEIVRRDVAQKGVAASRLYWAAFTCGLDAERRGQPLEDNSYFKVVEHLITTGTYDPAFHELRSRQPEIYMQRMASRLRLHALGAETRPPISINGFLPDTPKNAAKTGVILHLSELGQPLPAIILDGWHRLYSALLLGQPNYPAELLFYPGILDSRSWGQSMDEFFHASADCIERILMAKRFPSTENRADA